LIYHANHKIAFAHTSFKWANLASHNAGVTVVIVGISNHLGKVRQLYSLSERGEATLMESENINAYLAPYGDILLAREAHFPATIADLYDPAKMPENLRAAHERNDETLERIYIGRRFKNDTERLEQLFEFYTQMTTGAPAEKKRQNARNLMNDDRSISLTPAPAGYNDWLGEIKA